MTVIDGDGSNSEIGALDAFDRSRSRSASSKQASATEPVFAAGWILAGAHLHCVASSLKFALRATERLARTQVKLLSQARPSDRQGFPVTLRTVVDEARGCLGDISEIASEEFRQLQGRLDGLQEATRRLVPEADISDASYRRRWKAKP